MPSRLLPLGFPQRLIVGRHDADWGEFSSTYLASARELSDDEVDLRVLDDAGHFELINPATTAWPVVLETARRADRPVATGQARQPRLAFCVMCNRRRALGFGAGGCEDRRLRNDVAPKQATMPRGNSVMRASLARGDSDADVVCDRVRRQCGERAVA